MRRRLRLPRALAALLGATAILGAAWALVVPPFQSPDENWHVAYLQTLVEQGRLPGQVDRPTFSTEQQRAADVANAEQTQQVLLTNPEWSEAAYDRWREAMERSPQSVREDGGGPNFALANPPLYYTLGGLAYRATADGDLFARLTSVRLLSTLFLLVTVAATWALAGTVFGPRRDLQLAAAAVPALLPMVTFISSSISPDTLLYALWSVAFWLGARLLKRQGGPLDMAGLLGVTGLAIATKAVSYALIPAVVVVAVIALWRLRHRRRLVLALAASAVLAFAVPAGALFVFANSQDRRIAAQLDEAIRGTSQVNEREFASYVWQYYLPRLPFQTPYPGLGWPPPKAYETWVRQSFGAFGWLEVRWPNKAYWPVAAVVLLVLAGALTALVRRRRRLDLPLLAFFGSAVVALVIGLHWNEYRLAENTAALTNQGRYLFPLVALGGLTFATALTVVGPRLRPVLVGASVGALAVLQLFSLALVAERFYA